MFGAWHENAREAVPGVVVKLAVEALLRYRMFCA